MIGKYRVVTITPVGRRKYIELLYPQLLANKGIIDEHLFVINTDVTYDIGYVYALAAHNADFCKVVGKMRKAEQYITNHLYCSYNDLNTIYIKISDDICWLHRDAIKNLVEFCIDNYRSFIVYPMTINTGKTTMFYQIAGILPSDIVQTSPLTFRKDNFDLSILNPQVSVNIHNNFISSLDKGNISAYLNIFQKYIIHDYEHIPLHCVAWMGRKNNRLSPSNRLGTFDFLTKTEPQNRKTFLAICGNSLVSHFSYDSHEDYILNNTDIYSKYKTLLENKI